MLGIALGWIPIIGPFIKAAFASFDHYQDTTVQKTKIGADERVAEGGQDVQVIQTRANVAIAFKDDIGVMLARDVLVNWYAVYNSLIFYDSCFRNILPPYMTWRVLALPDSLNYLCGGIVAFLFVAAWRGK